MNRRRLPHVFPPETAVFLTWHLHGSLPTALYPPPGRLNSGHAFVWMDRYLDTTPGGRMWLRQPEVVRVVVACIQKGVELKHYRLHAYVAMANYVHLLITPLIDPGLLIKFWKGASAREANRLLGEPGRSGRRSYDHWVRNQREFEKIRAYIEENPVKAGLAAQADLYPWSSAGDNRSN